MSSAALRRLADDEPVRHVADAGGGRRARAPCGRRRCRPSSSPTSSGGGLLGHVAQVADEVGGEVVERAAGGGDVDEPEDRRARGARPRVVSCIARLSSERTGWRAGAGKASASSRPIRCTSASRGRRPPRGWLAAGSPIRPNATPRRARGRLYHRVAMRVKFCGITTGRGRARGGPPGRLGDRAQPLRAAARGAATRRPRSRSAPSCGARRRSSACSSTRPCPRSPTAVEDEQLTMIQLHGDEGPSFCREAARRTGCKVIKALRVRSTADIQAAEAYRTDFHLFDAHRAGNRGRHRRELRLGAARRAALRRADDPRRRARPRERRRGDRGRAPRTRSTSPAGSRSSPGIKDHALMAAFAEAAGVRGAGDRGRRIVSVARASRSASAPTAAGSCPRS